MFKELRRFDVVDAWIDERDELAKSFVCQLGFRPTGKVKAGIADDGRDAEQFRWEIEP